MSHQIIRAETFDVRFPTSKMLDGSDAMNADPDYSAAYLRLFTNDPALTGDSLIFTIGRGNEPEALVRVEPLHDAFRHVASTLFGEETLDISAELHA